MATIDRIADVSQIKLDVHTAIKEIADVMTDFSEIIQKQIPHTSENRILLKFVDGLQLQDVEQASTNLKFNLEILKRNKMKCAFFGKTSNGKSSVINAILKERVLPSYFGQTTSCFIKVDGCDEDEAYLMDSDARRRTVDELDSIANVTTQGSVGADKQIVLFWPKKRCSLLANDITLLDCPGVDFSEDHKKYIQSYCRDADVFVYVVDACSTFNESEKLFFKDVKATVTNPDIIILMNKWDKVENEASSSKLSKVKRQHEITLKNFFKDDLEMDCELNDRMFFVSAKEMLEAPEVSEMGERREQFNMFVDLLLREMSHNALLQKIKPHIVRADECIKLVLKAMNFLLKMSDGDVKERGADVEEDLLKNLIFHQNEPFQKIMNNLKYRIDNECKCIVSTVKMKSTELSRLDEKIGELAQRIMSAFSHELRRTIGNILGFIKTELIAFSAIKADHLMDVYVPSTENEDKSIVVPVEPGVDPQTQMDVTNGDSDSLSGGDVPFRADVASTIAIILPLTIELGVIFSQEHVSHSEKKDWISGVKESWKMELAKIGDYIYSDKETSVEHDNFPPEHVSRSERKDGKSEAKGYRKKELAQKISDSIYSIVERSVEHYKEKIERLTDILVRGFIKDHNECVQIIEAIRPLRDRCDRAGRDIDLEMQKIDNLLN